MFSDMCAVTYSVSLQRSDIRVFDVWDCTNCGCISIQANVLRDSPLQFAWLMPPNLSLAISTPVCFWQNLSYPCPTVALGYDMTRWRKGLVFKTLNRVQTNVGLEFKKGR